MTDRGILFSPLMVAALLAGTKTQTRRVLKPEPMEGARFAGVERDGSWLFTKGCAYGKVRPPAVAGDRLYVRETYYQRGSWARFEDRLTKGGRQKWGFVPADDVVLFDEPTDCRKGRHSADPETIAWHKRLARFMPRTASRITLIVRNVRVERLTVITEADAIAEGIERIDDPRGTAWKSYETYPDGTPHPHAVVPNRSPITSYRELWDSLRPNEGERWADNPWVVATTFEVVRRNIDQVPA